ncbi:CDP-diacylglycerol--glycerol-3-phosphate 3-phosphatidyltransferase [Bertholletia excelsa]
MPALKLSQIASLYAMPYKLARTMSRATVTITTLARPKTSTSALKGHHEITPPARTPGWRITPRAPLNIRSQGKIPCGKLGFRSGHRTFYSSEDRGGVGGSGGVVTQTDMGSENKDDNWPPEDSPLEADGHCRQRRQKPMPPQHREEPVKLLTLPTVLTIGRVVAVPVFVCTFYVNSWWGPTATTSIFIAAAITDWLDGYIARKMRLGSAFGAFLDPVADKLMVAATLVLLCTRPLEVATFGQVPWLLAVPAIAIIGREITMSAVREWAASQNGKLSEAVAVNNLGKWKTATQMAALTILLATRDSSLASAGMTLAASGVILLYISAWLSVWSLVVYMRKIWKVLLK